MGPNTVCLCMMMKTSQQMSYFLQHLGLGADCVGGMAREPGPGPQQQQRQG